MKLPGFFRFRKKKTVLVAAQTSGSQAATPAGGRTTSVGPDITFPPGASRLDFTDEDVAQLQPGGAPERHRPGGRRVDLDGAHRLAVDREGPLPAAGPDNGPVPLPRLDGVGRVPAPGVGVLRVVLAEEHLPALHLGGDG